MNKNYQKVETVNMITPFTLKNSPQNIDQSLNVFGFRWSVATEILLDTILLSFVVVDKHSIHLAPTLQDSLCMSLQTNAYASKTFRVFSLSIYQKT